jgi:hypothetical protein
VAATAAFDITVAATADPGPAQARGFEKRGCEKAIYQVTTAVYSSTALPSAGT